MIAGMLLMLPLQWVMAAILAAAVHELFHMLALCVCGVKIHRLRIGAFGTKIDVGAMPFHKEMICALAGPIGGFVLLLFSRWLPRVAVCGAIHSLYNLLPLYPMDGGRVLRCVIQLLCPSKADSAFLRLQIIFLVIITVLGIYACLFMGLGLMPLLFVAVLWRKTKIHLANGYFYGYNSANLKKR